MALQLSLRKGDEVIELYGGTNSRWVKCYWLLKELGLEFAEHSINFAKGEQKSPEMLKLNPFGLFPVLKDGDLVIFESMAILNYIGEKYPEYGVTPKSGTRDRAFYDQWMSFCVTELEQPLWRMTKHLRILPEEKRLPQEVALAKANFVERMKIFDPLLGGREFLVGNRFTAADVAMTYTLVWAQRLDLLEPFEYCMSYIRKMTERPSFPKHLYGMKT